MNKLLSVLVACLLLLAGTATADGSADAKPRVHLQTGAGDIVLALDPARAPKTVENFLTYVRAGFYDGTIFHRVIAGFMIQGGGYTTDYRRKDTRPPITNEADNGLKNRRGTISIARTGEPHSATSQFFINVVDNEALDFRARTDSGWGYAVFGEVVGGMDVVNAIADAPTGAAGPFPTDAPQTQVVIEKAYVEVSGTPGAGSPATTKDSLK